MSGCGHEKIIIQLQKKTKQQDEVIKQLQAESKQQKLIIENLIESNKELQKKLSYYENAHSPPSKNSLEWRKQKRQHRQPGKSRRGGIAGHVGKTQKFRPTSTKHHRSDACPKCGSENIHQTKTCKRIMVEIPPPTPYGITEHVLNQYICMDCSDNFQTTGNLPSHGCFDGSVIREVVSLFSKRLTYDAIRATLYERYGLEISNTTVQSILRNGSVMLESFYNTIHSEIVTEKILGIDETGFSIDGDTGWMWVARSKTSAQYALEYSRGANVLKKYWKKFKGTLVSDGYAPYRTVFCDNTKQRCTAHLQRDAKYLAIKSKDKKARILYEKLSGMLGHARVWSVGNRHTKRRETYRNDLLKQLDRIIARYLKGDTEMVQFGKKLKTARNSMFTFVMDGDVPSTNNDAENSIRKCVMQRNVRGQMKSDQGMRMISVFLTCFETWRIRELNMFSEMAKYI